MVSCDSRSNRLAVLCEAASAGETVCLSGEIRESFGQIAAALSIILGENRQLCYSDLIT
jgi:hypothetical protein